VFTCSKHVSQYFIERGEGGKIVNTSSGLGLVGAYGQGHYSAAKHGVLGVTKTAAMEVSDRDIRINAVCPGYIETPMITQHGDRVITDEEKVEEIRSLHPADRLGQPEEVADAVVWLCSEEASFVTGESISVDGGYLAGK
jgi:NAD(P)-dependent dehydrogenase (short-subunit alcohol dehydrogenase family)